MKKLFYFTVILMVFVQQVHGQNIDKLRLGYDKTKNESTQIGFTVSFSGDNIAYVFKNGTINIIDIKLNYKVASINIEFKKFHDIRFNQKGTKLLVVTDDKIISVIDIKQKKIVKEIKAKGYITKFETSKYDNIFVFGTDKKIVNVYSFDNYQLLNEYKINKGFPANIEFIGDRDQFIITQSTYTGVTKHYIANVNSTFLKVLDIDKGIGVNGFFYNENYDKVYANVYNSSEMEFIDKAFIIPINLNEYAIIDNNLSLIKSYPIPNNMPYITYNGKKRHLLFTFSSFRVVDGVVLFSNYDNSFFALKQGSSSDKNIIYNTFKSRKMDPYEAIPLELATKRKTIYPLYDGKSFITSADENYPNINQIYNVENNSIIGYLYSDSNFDFGVVARDGRMDGKYSSISKIYWTELNSSKKIPVDATFDQFYTPKLLPILLQATKTVEVTEIEKIIKFAPEVQILLPDSVSSTNSSSIKVSIKTISHGDEIEGVKLYVNGKRIQNDTRGFKKVSHAYNIEVDLLQGVNIISTVAYTVNGYNSAPDQIIVNYKGPKKVSNLYVLSVGIDKYLNPKYNLNYATADAQAFTDIFYKNANDIFASVNITKLYDNNANQNTIVQAFSDIAIKAQPQDVFIFYYAGHGVMNEGNSEIHRDFYLALHNVTQLYGDVESLESKGLSAKRIKTLLSDINAQKQLIILDACQSGGAVETFAMRGATEEKAMMQLARSTGTVLIASTGTEQFATEFAELGHGVFTYSLLKGLNGAADGASSDKKITVKELESFINDAVPELTQKYKGSPQFPNSWSMGQDFPIVIIK